MLPTGRSPDPSTTLYLAKMLGTLVTVNEVLCTTTVEHDAWGNHCGGQSSTNPLNSSTI